MKELSEAVSKEDKVMIVTVMVKLKGNVVTVLN
jgi:hypothetical protein